MKKEIKRLPDSELAVMMVLWDAGEPVTSAYICDKLKNKKSWKVTSVLTFLSRLAKKGFVSIERKGRENIYTAKIFENEYLQRENKSFLEKLYGNSLTAFVSSLYDSKSISSEDLAELKKFLDEAGEDKK